MVFQSFAHNQLTALTGQSHTSFPRSIIDQMQSFMSYGNLINHH